MGKTLRTAPKISPSISSAVSPGSSFRPSPLRIVLIVLALLFLHSRPLFPQDAGDPNTLNTVALGKSGDYSRLVFTFEKPVYDVVVRRDDVDSVKLDFGVAKARAGLSSPSDDLVREVLLESEGDRLTAGVRLSTNHFETRDFFSRDNFSLVIDFKKDAESLPPAEGGREYPASQGDLNLEPVSLDYAAKTAASFISGTPAPGSPERMLQDAADLIVGGRKEEAAGLLEGVVSSFPLYPGRDQALFLLGQLYYDMGLPDNFQKAAEAFQKGVAEYPESFTAPYGAYMLGEINRRMGYQNEAAAFFKLAADSYPDSPWRPAAVLGAADALLAMGLNDEARKAAEPLVEKTPQDGYSLLGLLRQATADYQDTLYSQATEKFRDALDRDPSIYELYPEMLYELGDSYSYLNRPDLTVLFLEHALNLQPDHPKADVMLARIGNALQQMEEPDQAISYFNIAKDLYPDRDGGLVSQIRLADMGALSAFFEGDRVFDALERGSRQATVKMYDQIISQSSESPLLQLAYLKAGQAQAADGENAQAISLLRDLVTKFPKGVLVEEAKPILSRAVVNEAEKQYGLGEYEKVEELNLDNAAFIEGADRLRFFRILGQALERLGRFTEALDVWRMVEKESPERRLNDQKDLINAALTAKKPLEAFNQIKESAREFPEENDWLYNKLFETILATGEPGDLEAAENLLSILADPVIQNLTELSKLALSEAIAVLTENREYQRALDLMDRYREIYPDDELTPEYLLTAAKMEKRLNRPEDAWNRLSEFRVSYPEDERVPRTLTDTIDQARKMERYPDAWRYEELYRFLYPDEPKGRRMMIDRAAEQWRLGMPEKSLETLNLFQQEYPGDPWAASAYLDEYRKLKELGRMPESFQALADLRGKFPQDPLTKDSYLEEYRDAVAAGYPDDAFRAQEEFRRLYPEDPRNRDLLLEKAKDQFAVNRVEDGLSSWADFVLSYPDDPRTPDVELLRARLEYKEDMPEASLGHYREFLDRYPEHPSRPEVLLEVAAIEGGRGDYDRAFNDLEIFRREFPGRPEEPGAILDQIGYASALNRIDEAVSLYDIFRENFRNHPRYSQSFLDETRMLLARNRTGEAVDVLEDGIVNVPGLDDDPDVENLLLGLYLDEGRIEDWAGASEEYLRRDPNPSANLAERFRRYSQVAQVYQELGRAADAERNYDLALRNKPPDASGEALYTIAGGYKKMGQMESYRAVLEVMKSLPDPVWQKVADQELRQG
ncbi:MAG: tetratricopeptide repeat protein [Deltaproteobacteria bacterium]|nr:tetratricopeptide repeat protein [Deltaproteobacteria bacterium]